MLVLLHLKILISTFEGIIFRQPNNEQPVSAKQAACELFNARALRYFFKKKQWTAHWREKSINGALSMLDRSEYN
jgi:hypothetical protein